jgi:UDP-glucose 4-epimerase
MKVLVFGGAGFVGLNIAAALLARGHAVTVFDRTAIPPRAAREFAAHGERLIAVQGDVRNGEAVQAVIAAGYDAIILGAAITAGPEREASDPATILQVNLLAQAPILTAAHRSGVRRIVNLSSAAAYGASAFRTALLDEETPCDPASLYAITKFASERVAARLAALRQQDIISVRLSAVFGPWERSNDVRDTPSAPAQILAAMQGGYQAVLSRPGVRDWVYATDVGEAVSLLVEAPTLLHPLYNISSGMEWSALQWGEELAALHPGFVCRLADAGEVATVDLHSAADRAPLSVARMADEFGWRARFGCADSAADLSVWWKRHREDI